MVEVANVEEQDEADVVIPEKKDEVDVMKDQLLSVKVKSKNAKANSFRKQGEQWS